MICDKSASFISDELLRLFNLLLYVIYMFSMPCLFRGRGKSEAFYRLKMVQSGNIMKDQAQEQTQKGKLVCN